MAGCPSGRNSYLLLPFVPTWPPTSNEFDVLELGYEPTHLRGKSFGRFAISAYMNFHRIIHRLASWNFLIQRTKRTSPPRWRAFLYLVSFLESRHKQNLHPSG